jgi:hypothetical protein
LIPGCECGEYTGHKRTIPSEDEEVCVLGEFVREAVLDGRDKAPPRVEIKDPGIGIRLFNELDLLDVPKIVHVEAPSKTGAQPGSSKSVCRVLPNPI